MSLFVERVVLLTLVVVACVGFGAGFFSGWAVRDRRSVSALEACSRQTARVLDRAERAERLAASVAERANAVIEAWPEFEQRPDDAGRVYLSADAVMRLLEEADAAYATPAPEVTLEPIETWTPMTTRGPQ